MARVFDATHALKTISSYQMPQTAFTAASWIYPTSFSANGIISSVYNTAIGGPAAYFQFTLLASPAGGLFGRIQQAIDTVYINQSSNAGVFTLNQWNHALFTWNGGLTSAAITLYANGSPVASTGGGAGSFTGPYSGSAIPITIGCQISGVGIQAPFTGRLADAAFWSVALTAAEISALAAGIRPFNIRPQSLFSYWSIDGIESPEPDFGGSGRNAALFIGLPPAANGPPVTLFTPKSPILAPPTTPTVAQIFAFNQTGARFSRNITTIGY